MSNELASWCKWCYNINVPLGKLSCRMLPPLLAPALSHDINAEARSWVARSISPLFVVRPA